ncbi:MAG TPA: tRNA adenosine(34) deaminase TadA [Bryobacteraceae bacterium]|nr:tRNA adenosine(34) deaminase TadA [Bryobacteraceae bacterium]
MADPVQPASPEQWNAADHRFMQMALELAQRAAAEGEVPVGAVVVSGDSLLGRGWNRPISSGDPTWHAEIAALRAAALAAQNYRLPGATLYVTLEPCAMCAGAIVLARFQRLVFAARDLRFGAVRSKFRLADSDLLNHRVDIQEGLFAAESASLLANFFHARRLP